jgi:hypothetical protein
MRVRLSERMGQLKLVRSPFNVSGRHLETPCNEQHGERRKNIKFKRRNVVPYGTYSA